MNMQINHFSPSSADYETVDHCDRCNGLNHSNLQPKVLGTMHHAIARSTGEVVPVLFIGYCCSPKAAG